MLDVGTLRRRRRPRLTQRRPPSGEHRHLLEVAGSRVPRSARPSPHIPLTTSQRNQFICRCHAPPPSTIIVGNSRPQRSTPLPLPTAERLSPGEHRAGLHPGQRDTRHRRRPTHHRLGRGRAGDQPEDPPAGVAADRGPGQQRHHWYRCLGRRQSPASERRPRAALRRASSARSREKAALAAAWH